MFLKIRRAVAGRLPKPLLNLYRRLAYAGSARECPLCERKFRVFQPAGVRLRPDACCANCDSLERHRSVWLLLRRSSDVLESPGRVLHIAPERCIAEHLAAVAGAGYVSADIEPGRAMVQLDITNIPYPEASFDLIYCSHVLEHVADDVGAMRELRRVLSPRGIAVVQVPIAELESTFEDWRVQSPEDRLRVFGQSDHVRIYGRDFSDRLRSAGFTVRVIEVGRAFPAREVRRFGLDPQERIFLCAAE